MTTPEMLRVLIVDDSSDDAQLISEALSMGAHEIVSRRVDDVQSLRTALANEVWDVVISDYSMPILTADEALRLTRDADPNLPFLVVSGVIGEDVAVEMMRAGAADYVMKDRLGRLLPAILRELRDAGLRRCHQETERALTDLRARLQATVERAPVGIVNVDREGRFLHVNPRFCDMVAYRCEELLRLHFSDITHDLDLGSDAQKMMDMADGHLAEYRTEKRYWRKDGELVWASLSTAPVRDSDGNFLYFASIMLDITEKKRMEASLRERDERYRQIVDTAEEGIWTVDIEDRTTFVNHRMAEMLGYTEAEMSGRRIHDFVHEDDLREVEEHADLRRRGLSGTGEFLLRRKDGANVRIHFAASPLRAADGTHNGALAMVTDVTARWEAEQTVRRQKRDLEEAQRIAHIGSWRCRLPGDSMDWSEELYRILGLDQATVPTLSLILETAVPEDRQSIIDTIAQAGEDQQPFDLIYRIKRPDESVRSVHTFGEIVLDETGVAVEIRGVTKDVTDRLAAVDVHEKLIRHLQLLLESTTQGIYGIDPDGRCTFINRAASDYLGYAPGELVGISIHEVAHTSYSSEDCPIGRAARTGVATGMLSDVLTRRDGTPLPVEYSAAPIIDGGTSTGAVVVFTDVSERKLLQSQLEQSDRVSSLGRLAATMAHEFNNVLMGIQPFAELLSRQNAGVQVERATSNILQAVQRGRSITQGILRFARPAELVQQRIDVREWLGSMESALAAVAGDKVQLRVRIDGDSLFVRGDQYQLEQVLTNLVANARDAMQGEGELSINVERCMSGYVFPFGALQTVDQYLHMTVTDSGCGMDPATLKAAFDPFFTTKRSGTGLGLAVVHQVMQLHGGSIVPESVAGEGTVFHLFLPFSDEAFGANDTKSPAVRQSAAGSILLIEDDDAISSGVASLLRDAGAVVDVAASGVDALTSLATHVPDVIILDVGLPDIDGRKLYEQIAERYPDLAVVFASGSNDEALLAPYLKEGQVASLSKPYEVDALLHLVASVTSGVALQGARS